MSDRAALALVVDALRRRKADRPWVPHSPEPPQRRFLELQEDEALFGGQAGGGKSDCLLMDALADVDVPGFAGLMLRRTFPQLSQAGGLIPRSHEWLAGTKAHWSGIEKRWRFPSGASLTFGHLQHEQDKYNYQGGEFQAIYFDELTQFTVSQYLYMHSRVRGLVGMPVRKRIRSSSNPGGVGHDWVKERFVEPGDPGRPFIPSRLEDNPHLDREAYLRSLANLDETTRLQLAEGVWIRDAQGLIYPLGPDNLTNVPPVTDDSWRFVLAVDLGSSEKVPSTAFVVCAYSTLVPRTVYVLEAVTVAGMSPSDIAERINLFIRAYGSFIHMVVDEGGLGSGYTREFRTRWALPVEPAEKHSKLGFRKLLRGAIQNQELVIVEPSCGPLVEEFGKLLWNEDGTDVEASAHDHASDGALYGWRACMAWAAREPKALPKEGTPEHFARLEEEQLERERKALRRRQARKW